MSEHRIYDTKVDIKAEEVRKFYDERARKAMSMECPYTAVLLGDEHPNHAAEWNDFEKTYILPELEVDETSNVLDIGCGMGRWSETLIPLAGFYYGVDYSEEMVALSKKRNIFPEKEFLFECYSFQEVVKQKKEMFYKKFNKVVICGVCMYINDEELKKCFESLNDLLADECSMYLTETVATESRLTLNAFYSEALKTDYDVIYRMEEEYNQLYQPLVAAGFEITRQGLLPKLNKEEKYSETERWYSILKRNRKRK